MRGPQTQVLLLELLAAIGIADSSYLTLDTFAKVPPYCPTYHILDCGKVTLSPYSHPFGVPVALLGLGWFVVMLALAVSRPSFVVYVMLPLWVLGVAMVGYLVFVELFLLHAICIYCTLAHVCSILMIFPILRLTFDEE